MSLRRVLCLGIVLAFAAGACASGTDDDDGMVLPPVDDADSDGISDEQEGKDQNIDTDGDGTPDWQDDDSDNDNIPDSVEAGISVPGGDARDADSDGVPDFRDDDSDGNGIPDLVEGGGDIDGDNIPDSASIDNDGDNIPDVREILEGRIPPGTPDNPVDKDNDGIPNYNDLDSDNDTISDREETFLDHDEDGTPSYLDTDSDNDCLSDALEAGDADLATPAQNTDNDNNPNFLDKDGDNDGLADFTEDPNCNGILDPNETSPFLDDTDEDGVSDLIENAAGTDARDPNDNSRLRGDFVFIVPFEETPTPNEDDLDFTTSISTADVYLLLDRSGSMNIERDDILTNIQEVAQRVTCMPNGSGVPGECIEDIQWGAGTIGYIGEDAYLNDVSINPSASSLDNVNSTPVNTSPPDEPILLALHSTITGQGSAPMCTIDEPYSSAGSCPNNGIGYPCFRPGALPIILLATDEAPIQDGQNIFNECPASQTVCDRANDINAKIIGIKGRATTTAIGLDLQEDLVELATCTGAVDSNNTPLVEDGSDDGADEAIEAAIRAIAGGIPLDRLGATVIDNPSDPVDAKEAFISHLETQQLGTAECADGLADDDTDDDLLPDRYRSVISGTPVCWKLVPKTNTTVEATENPQMFQATVEVRGDDITLLDSRKVFFLVPPEFADIPIIE